VTSILSSGIGSQILTRLRFKTRLLVGLAFIVGGLTWCSQVSTGGSYVSDDLFPSLLAAVGLGFSFVSVTIGAVTGTDDSDAGLASGLINTSQQVGGALGLAILVAIANSTTGNAVNDLVKLTDGFQTAFLTGAVLGAIGFV